MPRLAKFIFKILLFLSLIYLGWLVISYIERTKYINHVKNLIDSIDNLDSTEYSLQQYTSQIGLRGGSEYALFMSETVNIKSCGNLKGFIYIKDKITIKRAKHIVIPNSVEDIMTINRGICYKNFKGRDQEFGIDVYIQGKYIVSYWIF